MVHQLYLNGEWVRTPKTIRVVNPATEQVIGEVCTIDRTMLAKAIKDAHAAFQSWRRLTGRERGDFLRAFADELNARRGEIARTITFENGKPLVQSLGEVAMAVDHLRWYSEESGRAYGRTVPHQFEGKRNLVVKSPIGVVGAIAPWNFPLVLAVRKVAPALASGCTVILKLASATPLCAVALAQCAEAAKIPPGVFQIVVGPAEELAGEFLENPLCRKITFTGFAPVAPVCAFDSENEAVQAANDSPYGLCAYAFTSRLDRTFRLMESLEAGTIGLNDSLPSTSQCPFGGLKQSGWGRELGIEGMEAFLETKHVSLGVKA